MTSTIDRPRLADHAVLRQHVAGDDAWVTIEARDLGVMVRIGPREAAVLLAADGTRDHAGIVLAAQRRGVRTNARIVRKLFEELRSSGLLVDGPPEHDPETATVGGADPDVPRQRRIVSLPGHRFHCDGSGGCCRQYGAVLLSPSDRARALATYHDARVGPWPIEHSFTPQFGSAPSPVRVPTSRDGGCMFLEPDGACGIHRRAGAGAKPAGCRLYPLRLVDDGEIVRASVVTECRCALSEAPPAAEPLIAEGTTVDEVDPMVVVRRLPESISVDGALTWSRQEVRDWCAAALEASQRSRDPAAWCWDEARRLERESSPEDDGVIVEAYQRLGTMAASLLRGLSSSRPDAVRLHSMVRWIALSAGLLGDAELLTSLLEDSPLDLRAERLTLALMLWGFIGLGRQPITTWLRDRALRLWLARAMLSTRTSAESDSSLDEPIAVIDAIMRAYGLTDYRAALSG